MKLVALLLFYTSSLFAAQKAEVVTEGAIVYKGPSFDAPILGYFSQGKKVKVSDKVYGAFYRVRFKQGVIGYISDIDVRTERSANNPQNYFGNSAEENLKSKRPFFGGTYLGLSYGAIDFTDTVGGFTGNSQTSFIGGAFTSPLSFFDGAFLLSINALYSLEVPSFYQKVSKQSPEGFILVGDVQLLYPLWSFLHRKLNVYVGAGALVAYTNVELVQEISGQDKLIPTSSAKVGVSLSTGLTYQLSSFALRFEPKYYFEENAYLGVTASLLFQL